MHSNCSTIHAGDQLRSNTSEKAVVFSNGATTMMPILLLGVNVRGSNLGFCDLESRQSVHESSPRD